MRVYAATGAVLGWFALCLQLYLMLAQTSGFWLGTVITFLSFFTILTNTLVALVFTTVAVRPRTGWGQFLVRPSTQSGTVVYIVIVALVYEVLLRQLWNPQGAQWLADILLHLIVPSGYVLYWWLFAPREGIGWRDAVKWLAYPGAYLMYILARGAVTGVYPYPFIDVSQLGYAGALARAAVLVLVFLGMGFVVVAVARWRRGPGRQPGP